jgi:glutathione S-transferase
MIKLYQFPLSHYCEKVRWVLDYKDLQYKMVNLAPGPHFKIMKKLGVEKTSVPVIEHNGRIIQNSSDIISYLDDKYPDKCLTPQNEEIRKQALYWETYADEEIGVTLRLCFYHILLEERRTVLSMLTQESSAFTKILLRLIYPILKRKMIAGMNISDQAAAESQERLKAALLKVKDHLANREFMVGNSFSRADISVAALAAPILKPDNYGFKAKATSAKLDEFCAGLRPDAEWLLKFYGKYR